ncbi:Gustatory receptor [Aphis craccivora]|uniref:Gustatory receptor n=1 Tax=Aphis craccivora TaxID=307492 RepID=A0A6G0YRZ5_APHCR|nr:Gustatory receptor [Aphis craccivora]
MPPKVYDLPSISFIFFSDPNLLDMVIVTGGCFYIRSVASRFCALNDAYRRLPLGLVEIPGEWTQSQITMSLECLRLLHADLCEIIKVFSLGYGMIMLGYFTFSFVGLLMFTYMYFAVGYKDIPDMSFASVTLWCLPLIVRYCQYCIFHISIVVNASYANEKVRNYHIPITYSIIILNYEYYENQI